MTTEGATVRREVHRAKGKGRPSAATQQLLIGYHAAMRMQLREILTALYPYHTSKRVDVDLGERSKMWDLAIKLAKELGSEIDVAPPAEEPTPLRAHAAAADYG